jgi:ribosomal-protein-alanine N-acetyltransferase
MTATIGAPTRAWRATKPGRVVVRPLSAADAAAFVDAARASRTLHGRWVGPPASPEAFASRFKSIGAGGRSLTLVAVRYSDGARVGVFNLSEIVRGALQQAFLGYYAFAPHAGHGYMSEAMPLVLRYAFAVLKLHRVEANIQPANTASLALVRSAGFVKEGFSERYLKVAGRWRDHERWALNAEQWKATRAPR